MRMELTDVDRTLIVLTVALVESVGHSSIASLLMCTHFDISSMGFRAEKCYFGSTIIRMFFHAHKRPGESRREKEKGHREDVAVRFDIKIRRESQTPHGTTSTWTMCVGARVWTCHKTGTSWWYHLMKRIEEGIVVWPKHSAKSAARTILYCVKGPSTLLTVHVFW